MPDGNAPPSVYRACAAAKARGSFCPVFRLVERERVPWACTECHSSAKLSIESNLQSASRMLSSLVAPAREAFGESLAEGVSLTENSLVEPQQAATNRVLANLQAQVQQLRSRMQALAGDLEDARFGVYASFFNSDDLPQFEQVPPRSRSSSKTPSLDGPLPTQG